jgi:hypothetical protein
MLFDETNVLVGPSVAVELMPPLLCALEVRD